MPPLAPTCKSANERNRLSVYGVTDARHCSSRVTGHSEVVHLLYNALFIN
jgi:hypothetical protein